MSKNNSQKQQKSTQKGSNSLKEPKWKQRTYDTHLKHIKMFQKKTFKVVFLGDSMMERWLSTGREMWNESFREYANLGVGGDGIEHLLFRLTKQDDTNGILDLIKVEKKIIFMIGTNNLEKRTVEDILEGIKYVIKLIFEKQLEIELLIYGLPPRSDIKIEKIEELNLGIYNFVKDQKNINYIDFKKLDLQKDDFDDHVHLSKSGYKKWYADLLKSI